MSNITSKDETLKECPWCKRPSDSEGGINHVGGCAGLENAGLNRLQIYMLLKHSLPETKAERCLGNLLAIIHGDGGHYQAKHGDEKATEDAIAKYYATRFDALCPHGMPLAENICGPCSQGHPNRPAEKSEGDCPECEYYRSTGLGSCKKCGRDLVHCPKCKTTLAFEGDVCGLCNPVAQP